MKTVKLATIKGGHTKKSFGVHWDPETKRVYVEQPTMFSSTMIDTKLQASRAEMASRHKRHSESSNRMFASGTNFI
jgi:hypothetical protein